MTVNVMLRWFEYKTGKLWKILHVLLAFVSTSRHSIMHSAANVVQ